MCVCGGGGVGWVGVFVCMSVIHCGNRLLNRCTDIGAVVLLSFHPQLVKNKMIFDDPNFGIVVELNQDGKIVRSLQDPRRQQVHLGQRDSRGERHPLHRLQEQELHRHHRAGQAPQAGAHGPRYG